MCPACLCRCRSSRSWHCIADIGSELQEVEVSPELLVRVVDAAGLLALRVGDDLVRARTVEYGWSELTHQVSSEREVIGMCLTNICVVLRLSTMTQVLGEPLETH